MSNNTFQVADIDQKSGEQTDEYAKVSGIETHLPKLQDVDHPLVPESDNKYFLREMEGNLTDVELVSFAIEDEDHASLIVGEAGVGKNACYSALAEAANWPMVRFSLGSGVTYGQLVGRFVPSDGNSIENDIVEREEAVEKTANRFINQDGLDESKAFNRAENLLPKQPSFKFQYGVLSQAVKNGWFVVFDELNAMEQEQAIALNQIIEDRSKRELTILETSEVIKPHENFRLGATMNPPSYAGTQEVNSALKSRFYPIEFDYLPPEGEKAILRAETNIFENESEQAVEQLISLVNDIRIQQQSGNNIMTRVSSRSLKKIAKLTDVMDIRSAARTVLLGIADPTDEQSISEEIKTQKFN